MGEEKSKLAAFKAKAAAPGAQLTREKEGCRPKGTALRKTILAGAEEGEEVEVAENLELLADFVADVGVVGMKFGEFVGAGVDVG